MVDETDGLEGGGEEKGSALPTTSEEPSQQLLSRSGGAETDLENRSFERLLCNSGQERSEFGLLQQPQENLQTADLQDATQRRGVFRMSTRATSSPKIMNYYQAKPAIIVGNNDPRLHERGVTGKVEYEEERYCGRKSWILALFGLPCVVCCPCDRRTIVTELTSGRRVVLGDT